MKSANKVVLNTSILYLRMFLTVGFTLLSTRYVLSSLGKVDFGIFNLISGVIVFLSFLNAAMSVSTQRYFSFHQGKGDLEMQKSVFGNSLILHIGLGIFIVAILEIAGLFLFKDFLNIPEERLAATQFIYHLMSGTVFFTVLSVPFTGMLNAHEDMIWVASVNIIETLLKFGLSLLLFIISGDKLIFYGLSMSIISILTFGLYAIFCLKKYKECSLQGLNNVDTVLIKELTSFAGWNLFGILSWLGRTQGLAILLNLFLGAVVNAAYGIANQVAAQLNFFSSTLLKALNPQIMKSEGANDRERMIRLSMMASKFCFFLLAIIAIPCIFEMPAILGFWLKDVPENTIVFCSLMLVGTLVNQLTIGLQSAVQATGKIKFYQIIIGGTLLLNLPVAYFLLLYKFPLYSVIISYILFEFFACMLRILILKKLIGLSIKTYFIRVFLREIGPIVLATITCFYITSNFISDYRVLMTGFGSFIIFSVSIYFLGLEKEEKTILEDLINKVLKGVFRLLGLSGSK